MSTLKTPTLYRAAELQVRETTADDRRLDLSFSSEEPVDRFFGAEILEHTPEAVELGRLNDGGPVLVNHDTRDQVGVVESARIEDRRGRAEIRFGKSERAREILEDVVDGIRRNVSVGYRVLRMVLEEKGDDAPPVYRVTHWEPLEISLVPVPADQTVGIGRGDDPTWHETEIEEGETMSKKRDGGDTVIAPEQISDQTAPPAAAVTAAAVRTPDPVIVYGSDNGAAELERERAREILAIGREYPAVRDFADAAVADGMSLDAFRAAVIPRVATAPAVQPDDAPLTEIGLSDRERKEFSILRWARAVVQARDGGSDPRRIAPFELEASEAVAEQLRRQGHRESDWNPRGLLVPGDVMQRGSWLLPEVRARMAPELFYRAPPMDTVGSGALVGTDHLAESFIEALRPMSVLIRAGAIMLPGLVGNVDIPKQTGRAAFTWINEDEDSADAETPVGTVALTPKTVSSSVPITRRLLKQSSPPVESIVRNDLTLGAAEALDLAGINGDAKGPTGIVNETGVQTVDCGLAASQITWANWVDFETQVAAQNALRNSPAYLVSPTIAGGAKTTLRRDSDGAVTTVSPTFAMDGGMINGYAAMVSTHLNTAEVVFGDYAQAVIGMWGVLDLTADTATKAASGGLVLRAFLDADVVVRHGQAFSKATRT